MMPEKADNLRESTPTGSFEGRDHTQGAHDEVGEHTEANSPVRVEIELSEQAIQYLGPDHTATVKDVVEKEATRLWHNERCKPKPHKAKRPRGRPPLSAETRRARELGKKLMEMYLDLQERDDPPVFEEVYGEQFQKLNKAVAEEDLPSLQWFDRERPWQGARVAKVRELREKGAVSPKVSTTENK